MCTTHSKTFLDAVEPDEVRFLVRDEKNGATRIEAAPTDNENWRDVYCVYQESLGDLWLSGAVGGVPAI